jgi:hypothetical protein
MIQVVDYGPARDEARAGNRPLLPAECAPQGRRENEQETTSPVDLFPAESPPISWPRVLPGL